MLLAIGFVLGFLGYLPIGNINMAVVQLSVNKAVEKLWAYIIFIAVMEFIYSMGCLAGIEVLMHQPGWMIILRWTAVFIFVLLGILSFLHKEGGTGIQSFSVVKRGIFIAIFNPLQVPYWTASGIYLIENHFMKNDGVSLCVFALGTALGSIAILCLYSVGGKILVAKLKVSDIILNSFIGTLFFVLAAWQLVSLLHHTR